MPTLAPKGQSRSLVMVGLPDAWRVHQDGPINYPVDEGDDDDDSSGDDADGEDEEEAFEEDKEELLASADSTTATSPVVDPVPSAEVTEPFEADESTTTPPPPLAYHMLGLKTFMKLLLLS
nr:hypothetical protein [Tanacetum cinerariifolium]